MQVFSVFTFFKRRNVYLASFVLGAAVLGGCAVPPSAGTNKAANLDTLFSDVESELAKGRREQALALLNDAAQSHPTSIVPWLKIATVWFEAGNYPSSILAANEVLQRDPANQDAKSLLVVAGLRVAANAVSGLRPTSTISTGVRADAESLTNSLRGVLGEKVLVPAQTAEIKPATPVLRNKPRIAVRAPSNPVSAGAAMRSPAADPFKALK
ncbi:hypothetical protein D3871_20945 [Noviherbaspirillum saxi]|uniref:Uncharacterized protein n=2 Tax=Noviherbaspirillum saxi TaxID=2320863 RepID=A0A3A3FJZ3_9BURK|nr:hypothetical protein D3871_20945 [Noviherbaspirillum saxi]